ncbi:MAG: D-alanine--D-alanine ligase [Sphaerochaeta sp.]|jgi:D-alanine-D-alanine ligase|nr:D-alanine--D-alanine ligase [Spirochaetales bacterium]
MRVALIYGGRSTEHLVSISSAKNVYRSLIASAHQVISIAITLEGEWYLQAGEPSEAIERNSPVLLLPGKGLCVGKERLAIDVAFAPTHGQGGEDGDLQGLCRLCAIPLVGCDTLSSSVGMYKMATQSLCLQAGIPTIPTLLISSHGHIDPSLFEQATAHFGKDLFIKAEASGSSVGVYALPDASFTAFKEAIGQARQFSERVLIQPMVRPLIEVECAVLERRDGSLVVSEPGRVVDPGSSTVGFLDYHHKYSAQGGAYMALPSGLEEDVVEQIKEYAQRTFETIKGSGYARIDFFVSGTTIYMNEINTAPGMTEQSHWPVLMAHAGWPLSTALDELLTGAVEHNKRLMALTYAPPELV